MCGIAGRFNFAKREPVDRELISRMAASISHRGPDDEGQFIAGPVGLGFRRLSIIDLAGGHQPMSDAEQTVWIVFNGEIYNFPELGDELRRRGHTFRTRSDTEVIIHGYKEWGTGVFDRLNGMFGVAIWDVPRQRLVVARDAMGIKPIYYRSDDGRLTFGSEMRAVLAADDRRVDVDPIALGQLLRFRYTPAPLTIVRGIRKLAPGHMLVAEDGACRDEAWYRYTPVPFEDGKPDRDAVQELLELYQAAVKRHLLSDVPLGIFLSGGVDSALLLALMNEHGGPWPAYTVGYGETFVHDELADAAETAAMLGARHVPVHLTRDAFERSLPKIVAVLEEPIASSSIVPMYFVAERARADVKVALIGQGPDELFGGYRRHLGVHYGSAWRRVPARARQALASAIALLPRNEGAKRAMYSLGVDDRLERYERVFSLAPNETIGALFRDNMLDDVRGSGAVPYWSELMPQMRHLDDLGGLQLLELRSSLADELLMYGDKLSMAHGLEVRVPYLDRTVVEHAQRLKAALKIRRGASKWVHRQVCSRYLPQRILDRRKRGFAVGVVDEWFSSAIQGTLTDLLLDDGSLMYGLLRPDRVRALLQDHRSGREDNHKLLFSLVMVEQWLRVTASRPVAPLAGPERPESRPALEHVLTPN
jgi:asparagine synthase (glutamine-hydrolysing)